MFVSVCVCAVPKKIRSIETVLRVSTNSMHSMVAIKAMYKRKDANSSVWRQSIPWKSALKRSQPNHITKHTQTFCIYIRNAHTSLTLFMLADFSLCLLFLLLFLFKAYDFGGCDFVITNQAHALYSFCLTLSLWLSCQLSFYLVLSFLFQ